MTRHERFHVVVLGARFGGLAAVYWLQRRLGHRLALTVIDQRATAVFRPALVQAMVRPPTFVRGWRIPLAQAVAPGQFVQDRAVAVDAARREVHLASRAPVRYDVLFWASGVDPAWSVIEGLSPAAGGICEDFLARHTAFQSTSWSGGRMLFVAGPYRADPAQTPQLASACECPLYEAALLFDEQLRTRNLRDRTELVLVTPAASVGEALGPRARTRLQALFEARGIHVVTRARFVRVEPGRLVLADGPLAADRMVWIPPYAGSELARASGLDDGFGWVPTSDHGRHRDWPDIYAVGDVAARLPKTAHAAMGQARVAVHHWLSTVRGGPPPAPWRPTSVNLIQTGRQEGLLTYSPGPVGGDQERVLGGPWVVWAKHLVGRAYVRGRGRLPVMP
jgi:sulfide:quinone oxidoreductase